MNFPLNALKVEHDLKLPAAEIAPQKGLVEVSLRWGESVMHLHRLVEDGFISIGEAESCDFQVTDACIPKKVFNLVTVEKGHAKLSFCEGMNVSVNGEEFVGTEFNLELEQQVVVAVGALEFVVQYSQRHKAISLGMLQAVDFFYSKVLAMVLMLQAMFIVAMAVTPRLNDAFDDDLQKGLSEYLILETKKTLIVKPELGILPKSKPKPRKEEGVFGDAHRPEKSVAASIAGAVNVDKERREEARVLASSAMDQLFGHERAAFSDQRGPGGLGGGINTALGGLAGASLGNAGGTGGLGSRGLGPGGGGNGIGIGGLSGKHAGGCAGFGCGGALLSRKGKHRVRIQKGNVVYTGALSRDEIQRVVNRSLSKMKHCYEKELNKNPNLSGKVVGSWTIGKTGAVTAARASQNTMGNEVVARCVVKNLKRMRFPQPKGEGSVFVTYPFVFDAK